jgi:hypothetical protein
MCFGGLAAIPITALDPPRRAASPAVPALVGSGSPLRSGAPEVGVSVTVDENDDDHPLVLSVVDNG